MTASATPENYTTLTDVTDGGLLSDYLLHDINCALRPAHFVGLLLAKLWVVTPWHGSQLATPRTQPVGRLSNIGLCRLCAVEA
jgi:hypothetical protein